jgi:putative transposase
MVTPAFRREAVAHLKVAYEVSERRACSALRTDRTSVRYRSRRPDDTPVVPVVNLIGLTADAESRNASVL